MYALIENGAIVKYPFTAADLAAKYPNSSLPVAWSQEFMAEQGIAHVVVTGRPEHDRATEIVEEGAPELRGDQWEQTWAIRPATTEEVAAAQRALQDEIVAATQRRLDAFAQTRGYDGILSAATYSDSLVARFHAEGQYALTKRDETWAALYDLLAEVQVGARPIPRSFDEIEDELPDLVWPAA